MNKKLLLIVPLVFMLFSGCVGMQGRGQLELSANQSVGDIYKCVISPEGVVRELSSKYVSKGSFIGVTGGGGKYIFTFEAMAEGEAEIIIYNHFRGGEPRKVAAYKATVDNKKKLTLTELAGD
jgi:hypothetical protein